MMKKYLSTGVILLLLISCQKELVPGMVNVSPQQAVTQIPQQNPTVFTKYTIAAGKQYADKNLFTQTSYAELKFTAKFDSSAIYSNSDPNNQYDINKLYGFSDNNSTHHQFSARFGWRWSDNALRLFGYIYNNGVRSTKELGTVAIGAENNCSVKITPSHYVFSLNNLKDSLPRTSATFKAEGYKLYPYFGGDESAPHDIFIYIKEL